MRQYSACVITAVAAVALAVAAAPARAQSFLQGSPDTISYGNVRLEGAPAQMFPHDGGPDRTGAALRLGYGITHNLGLEAKSGLFDGVTLLGGDGHLRLYDRSDTLATLTTARTTSPPGSPSTSRSATAPPPEGVTSRIARPAVSVGARRGRPR